METKRQTATGEGETMKTDNETAIKNMTPYFRARLEQGESVEDAIIGAMSDVRKTCEAMVSCELESSRAVKSVLCWQVFAIANRPCLDAATV